MRLSFSFLRFATSGRLAAVTTLAAAALGAASTAQARSDITWSIGISSPGVHVHPAPVYVPPAPVYLPPRTVHVYPAPVYFYPAPVVVQPPVQGVYHGGWPAWRRAEWERRHWQHRHGHGRDDGRGGRRD